MQMSRYFIEVKYKGTSFKGFQIQENGITVQGEINKALQIILKEDIQTTTSSRTDAGVHALQNFLHFDTEVLITRKMLYNMNAILDNNIVIKNIYSVDTNHHSRFDALSRSYAYHIIQERDPFLKETSYFYPLALDIEKLNKTSNLLLATTDFSSFAKRHSDVNNFNCNLSQAEWSKDETGQIIFQVTSNRFLRGMVRALVGTQLLVGRNKISIEEFSHIIASKDCTKADFSAPAHGLFLRRVNYPDGLLSNLIQ